MTTEARYSTRLVDLEAITDRQFGLRLAEREAKKLNKRFGVRSASHIRVEAYAATLGVKVIEGKLDGALARLIAGPEPIIRVSDRAGHPGDRSFGIGHELGHRVLEHLPARVGALCAEPHARPRARSTTRHPARLRCEPRRHDPVVRLDEMRLFNVELG